MKWRQTNMTALIATKVLGLENVSLRKRIECGGILFALDAI